MTASLLRRVCIVGGPNTGKTTLAHNCAAERAVADVYHTDDLIHLGWSEASAKAAEWLALPGDWIVEGAATARALRKWLLAHPGQPLNAEIIILRHPYEPLSKAQLTMAKGVFTVLNEILPDLRQRNVTITDSRRTPSPV